MQKNKKTSDLLKVSLHGMNDRMQKMMANYLELCCKGMTQVVVETESDVEIIDIDSVHSKSLLERRLDQQPAKPVIVLSLIDVSLEKVIFVKKPIDVECFVTALKTVEKNLLKKRAALKKVKLKAYAEISEHQPEKALENNLDAEKKETLTILPASDPELSWQQKSNTADKRADYPSSKAENPVKKDLSAKIKKSTGSGSKKLGQARIDKGEKKSERPLDNIHKSEKKKIKTSDIRIHSVPESASLKVGVVAKEVSDNSSNDVVLTPKPKKPVKGKYSSKLKKTTGPKSTLEHTSNKPVPIQVKEIDKLLKELHNSTHKLQPHGNKVSNATQENRRKTIRYAFYPIEAKLKKNALASLKNSLTVMMLDVSSRGARIEFKKPTKLRGKVTLRIQFDSQQTFVIPARVVRKEDKNIYGLQFLDSQHELTDFLVGSGRSFFFT